MDVTFEVIACTVFSQEVENSSIWNCLRVFLSPCSQTPEKSAVHR